MKKLLIASALIIGFVTPALAEQFYVTEWLDEENGRPL